MDKVKLLPCGVTDEDHSWLRREIWGRRHAGDEDDAQRLERMYNALLTRPPIVTDEVVERVKLALLAVPIMCGTYGLDTDDAEALARAAIAAMPTIDQDGGEQAFRDGLLAAEKMVRRFMGEHYGENSALMIDVDAGVQADKSTLAYVAESLARRAAKRPPAQQENDQCQD